MPAMSVLRSAARASRAKSTASSWGVRYVVLRARVDTKAGKAVLDADVEAKVELGAEGNVISGEKRKADGSKSVGMLVQIVLETSTDLGRPQHHHAGWHPLRLQLGTRQA